MTDDASHLPHPRGNAWQHAAPPGVVRSEERLEVTTRRRAVALARLVGYRETETVTRSVTLHHDRVRLEVEPLTADDPGSRPAGDGEAWVVLYDEEVVVTTRRVPRERVRLRVRTITADREVTDTLARERIDVEVDDTDG